MSPIEISLSKVQHDFCQSNALYRGFVGGRGAGKALALDTPIPTPVGWTRMGDIQAGDIVFDEQGKQCRVLYATPIYYGRPCYAVMFSDGHKIVTDEEHLWLTDNHASRKSIGRANGNGRGQGRWQCKRRTFAEIRTTKEISDTLLYLDRELNHSIPVAEPLECEYINLPVKPYTLGAWLGDGTRGTSRITSADEEIIEAIRDDGYNVEFKKKESAASSYYISVPGKTSKRNQLTGQYESRDGNLTVELRKLGVLRKKHIPSAYLRASIEQRQELLSGLMDTDGYIAEDGRCEYDSTSRELIDGVFELCISLGLKATLTSGRAMLYGKDCGPKYKVSFTPYQPIFRIARKAEREKSAGKQWRRQRTRYIQSVTPVASVPVRCIAVDSESHLYLASKGMIATHNTYIGSYDLIKRAKPKRLYGVYAPTFRMLQDSTLRTFTEIAEKLRYLKNFRRGDMVATLGNDSEILFRSLDDPERARGPNLSGAWIDEASLVPQEAFEIIIAALRAPGEMGWLSATFTPKGLNHWTYDVFGRQRDNTELFRSATSDNPFLPPEFMQAVSAQYTQHLAQQELHGEFIDAEGAIAKRQWFTPVEEVPKGMQVRYWDFAATKTSTSDYTVGTKMTVYDKVYYVEHVLRGKYDPGEIEQLILRTAMSDGKHCTIGMEQEPGSAGKLFSATMIKILAGWHVRSIRSTGDKVQRGMPFIAQAEAGNVRIQRAGWNEDWLDEMTSVPNARHDDQWDSASGAFGMLTRGGWSRGIG